MNFVLIMAAGLAGLTGFQPATTTPARPVDPALAAELTAAVEVLRPQLPIRQDPVTVTGIQAKGAELIFDMEVPMDLDADKFRLFQEQLPIAACANADARGLFERGGTYTYRLKDPGGEVFTTSINRC